MHPRLALAALALISATATGSAQDGPVQQGQALVTRLCAECHAVTDLGASPHAAAPPLRNLERRLDLDDFVERLRHGLTSGHLDMPTFRFSRQDARAVVMYLRSIQSP